LSPPLDATTSTVSLCAKVTVCVVSEQLFAVLKMVHVMAVFTPFFCTVKVYLLELALKVNVKFESVPGEIIGTASLAL
jgi:hypothetical protein